MLLNCGVGEDSWESLGWQGDQTINPKGNQPWILLGRTDTEAKASIFWSADATSWLIGKDSAAGKDWGQEKGMTEDELAGWHHRLNGHEFEQAPGDSDGQGSLVCCSPWVTKSQTLLRDWTTTTNVSKSYLFHCWAEWKLWVPLHTVFPFATPFYNILDHGCFNSWDFREKTV